MITPSFSTSFHKVMEGVQKPQIVCQTLPFKLKTHHVVIGSIVIISLFVVGYQIGHLQGIKMRTANAPRKSQQEFEKEE